MSITVRVEVFASRFKHDGVEHLRGSALDMPLKTAVHFYRLGAIEAADDDSARWIELATLLQHAIPPTVRRIHVDR